VRIMRSSSVETLKKDPLAEELSKLQEFASQG
jgi:hypothetical protein